MLMSRTTGYHNLCSPVILSISISIFLELPYRYRYFQNCLIDIDIDIFKNDHIDIDIDIDIFQKCRYIDNRYVISIYRTGLVVAKVDVRNAHNEIWRSAIISALEAEPTLQHLAWFAAVVLAPSTGLKTGGQLWGTQGEGETQGDPKASAFFATAIQRAVCQFDEELQVAGGKARFGNDDGYGCGPPDVVFPALARLAEKTTSGGPQP